LFSIIREGGEEIREIGIVFVIGGYIGDIINSINNKFIIVIKKIAKIKDNIIDIKIGVIIKNRNIKK
jgi:hypothetical protein